MVKEFHNDNLFLLIIGMVIYIISIVRWSLQGHGCVELIPALCVGALQGYVCEKPYHANQQLI